MHPTCNRFRTCRGVSREQKNGIGPIVVAARIGRREEAQTDKVDVARIGRGGRRRRDGLSLRPCRRTAGGEKGQQREAYHKHTALHDEVWISD